MEFIIPSVYNRARILEFQFSLVFVHLPNTWWSRPRRVRRSSGRTGQDNYSNCVTQILCGEIIPKWSKLERVGCYLECKRESNWYRSLFQLPNVTYTFTSVSSTSIKMCRWRRYAFLAFLSTVVRRCHWLVSQCQECLSWVGHDKDSVFLVFTSYSVFTRCGHAINLVGLTLQFLGLTLDLPRIFSPMRRWAGSF